MKRPSFQFYPGDWLSDHRVSMLTLEAEGLFIRLLCYAHQSDPRGYLSANGIKMTADKLQKVSKLAPKKFPKVFEELLVLGLFLEDEKTGAFFNERMVKDAHIEKVRAESGKKGGNPNLLNQNPSKNLKKANLVSNQKPTPSSSSSVNSVSTKQTQNASKPKKEKTLICGEPSASEPAAATPVHPIWGDVLDLLVTNGEKESSARTFLGRALKEYGENSLNEVSSRLILEQPVNPKAFMMGLLSQQKKKSTYSTKPEAQKISIEQTIREAWGNRKVLKHHIAGNFHPEALTPVNAAFQEVDIGEAYGLKTPTGDTFAIREWRIVE